MAKKKIVYPVIAIILLAVVVSIVFVSAQDTKTSAPSIQRDTNDLNGNSSDAENSINRNNSSTDDSYNIASNNDSGNDKGSESSDNQSSVPESKQSSDKNELEIIPVN